VSNVTDDRSKLRKGKLAGLILGIIIILVILAVVAFVLYKRQQKKKALGGVSHEPVCPFASTTLYGVKKLDEY
jgi:flagellar biosynthesis/type III secretory pathway M-ring protein FliF/YscJ